MSSWPSAKPQIFNALSLALISIFLCGCSQKIQLPPNYASLGKGAPVPTITVQDFDQQGSSSPNLVVSTTSPTTDTINVTLTPEKDKQEFGPPQYDASLVITGQATEKYLGIENFRLQVVDGYGIEDDVTVTQTLDNTFKVFPTLGIIGTDGSGQAGVKLPISIWGSGGYSTTVTITAVDFASVSKTLVVIYSCPKCSVNHGGPIGVTSTGPTGTPTQPSSCPARTPGSFQLVNPTYNSIGAPAFSSTDGTWSATVQATNPTNNADAYRAIMKRGPSMASVPFNIGTLPGSGLMPVGGVGFTANSKKAVIATYNTPQMHMHAPVSYQVVDETKLFTSPTSYPNLSAYETDPDPSPQAQLLYLQPQIYFSPDASLALVVSAPVDGTQYSTANLSAYDVCSGTSSTNLGGQNISGNFVSAVLVGNTIQATITGQTLPVTFTVK
jgi:hypothetical protein